MFGTGKKELGVRSGIKRFFAEIIEFFVHIIFSRRLRNQTQ
jgi:hypothetical protein